METCVPVSVQPLVDAYLHALEPLRMHFYGAYIYGSLALDAFEELESDIDVLVLTQGEWSSAELKQLEALHAQLIRKEPFGKRLEVLYVPLRDLGKLNAEIGAYPTVHGGKFSPATHGDLNVVTWWITKNKGIRLLGPEPSTLPFEVTWQNVLQGMHYNLEVYFAGKVRRPYIYLQGYVVEFAVTNLCRILTTIEDGEITSKSVSLARWRDVLPERWRPLIDEAWRIRHHLDQPSLYRNRFHRMRETLAFIAYVRERGGKELDVASLSERINQKEHSAR